MTSATKTLLALAAITLSASACTSGQDNLLHEIELSDPITLSGQADSADLTPRTPRRSQSGYIVAHLVAPPGGGIALFDVSGTYIKSLQAHGSGPGEFQRVSAAGFSAGDSLWVIDNMFRMHLFSPPPELGFVRTVTAERPVMGTPTPLGLGSSAYVTSDGQSAVVIPALLTDFSGRTIAQFGDSADISEAETRMGAIHIVDSTRAWVADGRNYSIELINSDGSIERKIERNVDWFPRWDGKSGLPWETPPATRINSLHVGADSLLWILIIRAHRDWEPSPAPTGPMPSAVPASARGLASFDPAKMFETVIEVFDLKSGKFVATYEAGGGMSGFVSAPAVADNASGGAVSSTELRLAEAKVDEDGFVTVVLWKLGLK